MSRLEVKLRYAAVMTMTLSSLMLTAALAASGEKPALIVAGAQSPAKISRAVVLTPSDGPPVVLYAVVSETDQRIDEFTVMAFVFRADGTLKARQVAPGRRNLDAHETKYSTLVLDGSPIESSDVVVIGINQAQQVGSSAWWRTDLQPAAEAAVPLKKK